MTMNESPVPASPITAIPVSRDEFCRVFQIPTPEEYTEANMDWVAEASWFPEEEEREPVSEDLWKKVDQAWDSAWGEVVKYMKEDCKLTISVDADGNIVFDSEDWDETAKEMIESINGYGMFKFEDVEDLVASGPYASVKDAVILHLSWHKHRSAIFGQDGVKQIFEKELEHRARYM
jgi:NDP-sugar pyrophosphorylase family protein